MPTIWLAWTISRRSRAPSAGSSGSTLALVADEDDGQLGVGGDGLDGAGDDRAGGVVAAHRVQGDPHGLLLLLGVLFGDDDAALEEPAVRADPVRQDRLVALLAILDLDGLDGVVAPPMALLGVGRSSLGNGHDGVRRLLEGR